MVSRARHRSSRTQRLRTVAWSAVVLASLLAARGAHAADCDAGATCPDDDHDGFAACGCAWSGTPCDCDDTDPTTFPGAPEPCDATKDKSCNGVVPDACGPKKQCLAGVCVQECVPLSDFGCPSGAAMVNPDGGACICAPKDCTVFGCTAGQSCDENKVCVPTCSASVKCPAGQICRGRGCVDPCAEVTCPSGAVCEGGLCVASCVCRANPACAPGQTCDVAAPVPACIDDACIGVTCNAGAHCKAGACVDDCEDVVCPPRLVCRRVSLNGGTPRAKCTDLCNPSPCPPTWTCDFRTAACTPPPADDRSVPVPPADTSVIVEVAGAGWLCDVAHLPGGMSPLSMVAGGGVTGAAFALGWRRRRKQRRQR